VHNQQAATTITSGQTHTDTLYKYMDTLKAGLQANNVAGLLLLLLLLLPLLLIKN